MFLAKQKYQEITLQIPHPFREISGENKGGGICNFVFIKEILKKIFRRSASDEK